MFNFNPIKPQVVQHLSSTAFKRDDQKYQVFVGRILTVDYEDKVCTLLDISTGIPYSDVSLIPANASSFESTDIQMPEPGTSCLAVPVMYEAGYSQIAIISYIVADTRQASDAIAFRPMEDVSGYDKRQRGTYRKAYPGQKTATYTSGYSEKIDAGWDRTAADLSRDKLDTHRREWTQITSRKVQYTDAGLLFSGPVNRPGASGILPTTMPDGSKHYVVYLQPGAQPSDRYLDGKQDVIPFAERTERIQEFSLDHPVPQEVLETDLLDEVLGTDASPWERTSITKTGNVSHDDQSYSIDQNWDSPYGKAGRPVVGPTTNEGVTPRRRAYIIEHTQGTLIGYNRFDADTYGSVLKPTLFTADGVNGAKLSRFSANVSSGYNPVVDSPDHLEARLAASCYAVRFPYEWNTTRWDVTKEGFISMEIGATIPQENIQKNGWQGTYEHPHGAGRSLELHTVGSIKAVIGKNRDEEEALDLTALGQVVLRIGADDTSLPNAGRNVKTQNRGMKDTMQDRLLQYWDGSSSKGLHSLGDPQSLTNKQAGENVSIRGALDGGLVLRVGARDKNAPRRHFYNGYSDARGRNYVAVGATGRLDSKSPNRPAYDPATANDDDVYGFHNLRNAGKSQAKNGARVPYVWSGDPVTDVSKHGLSADLHFCRDILLRIGKNDISKQSLLLDTDGGVVMALGKDNQNRSLTVTADGGAEITIGSTSSNGGLTLEVNGNVNLVVNGNCHRHVTGDIIDECTNYRLIAKVNHIVTAQNIVEAALGMISNEAPVTQTLNGGYTPINEKGTVGSS